MPELALPCRERDVVDSREVPQRYPGAPVHVLVPGGPEDFALAVCEVFPRVLPFGILPVLFVVFFVVCNAQIL